MSHILSNQIEHRTGQNMVPFFELVLWQPTNIVAHTDSVLQPRGTTENSGFHRQW
jgi:hypothetical protein